MPDPAQRVCVVPHLGLGDMFVLNALVRRVSAGAADVAMFVKEAYAKSVRNLFGDVANLRLWFVTEYQEIYESGLLAEAARAGYALLPLGVHAQYLGTPAAGWRALDPLWTRALYRQAGLDPGLMFEGFRATRSAREEPFAEAVRALAGDAYVVVHDDPGRGQVIDRGRLPVGVPHVHVDDPRIRSDNVFDYALAIDRALEFHGIDSSFMWLAAFVCPRVRKVCHAYVKDPSLPDELFGAGVAMVR